jgi:hypothetical protein
LTEPAAGTGAVETLRRWEEFGGVWQVTFRSGSQVTLSLCRCDGGEEVERLTFDDPELADWLDARCAGQPARSSRTSQESTPGSATTT